MTTRTFPVSAAVRRTPYPFPEPPPPEDMNDYRFLTEPGYPPALIQHFGGESDDLAIFAGAYISRELPTSQRGLFYPDLLIAFDADRLAVIARKGFVIAEQGKPPDFVLEIGSETTGQRDVEEKRDGYAALGIPEYWRFDHSGGQFHQGAALAGDRLNASGAYEPLPIEEMDDGYRGHSLILNLELHWDNGRLLWFDPQTQLYLPSYAAQSQARIAAEDQRDAARLERNFTRAERDTLEAERDSARAERDTLADERNALESERNAAEERARLLEAMLRRLQNPDAPP